MDCPDGPNAIKMVLIKGRQEGQSQRRYNKESIGQSDMFLERSHKSRSVGNI